MKYIRKNTVTKIAVVLILTVMFLIGRVDWFVMFASGFSVGMYTRMA